MEQQDPFSRSPSSSPNRISPLPGDIPAEDSACRQAAASLIEQKTVLEKIVTGGELADVLTMFCHTIEQQSPGMLCSVLLLEGTQLRHGAAPSLPKEYIAAIDGMVIGPQAGSCGTAAYLNEKVIVSDIATDPLWERGRGFALSHGLRACWSTPIPSSSGGILGTFAMYYSEPRVPSSEHQALIDIYSHLVGIAIERACIEKSFKRNEHRLQRLVETANVLPWEAEFSTWRMTYVGPQVHAMLGFSEAEWCRDGFWESHIHPEDREWVVKYCRDTSTRQRDFELEYRLISANGTTVWVCDLVSVIEDQQGKPKFLQGFMFDITHHKESEASHKKSEERLQAILDNSPAVVVVKDAQGHYLMVNRQWERLFSRQRQQVLGKTPYEVFPKATADALLANDLKVVQAMTPIEFEEVIPHEDGQLHTYLSVKFPVPSFDRDSPGVCGMATDITDRKKTEDLLEAQNSVLQLLACGEPLNTVLDKICRLFEEPRPGTFCSILLLDKEGKTLQLAAAPTMPKELAEGIDGLTIGDQNGSCGAAAFLGKQIIVPDVTNDARFSRFDDFPAKQGVRACWSTPFFGKDGKVLGSFGICHPVPCSPSSFEQRVMKTAAHLASIACERQRTEDALQESEARLRQSQKMEAIGTLAGGIAHDFNNILTATLGFTELAMTYLPKTSPGHRYLEEVHAAGLRAKGLTKQILVFSRQTDQERKPIQLHQVVQEALGFLRATLPTTIELNSVLKTNISPIIADPVQMHQVLVNLCTNAAQAMGEAGGAIDVHLESVRLTSEQSASLFPGSHLMPGLYLKLIVRDTGPGMPHHVLERVFEPFFTTKGVGEGVGLGLSVVHGIITSHGGGIKAESVPAKGTTFSIYLPQEDVTVIRESPTVGLLEVGKGERILFVEDEKSIAHLGQEILQRLGYAVSVETRSPEALKTFREAPEKFDLVITDQTMPHMTGENLAREFLRIRPDIPIILCTGYSPNMTPEKAQNLGIRAFLWKPLILQDLSHTIHEVLTTTSGASPAL